MKEIWKFIPGFNRIYQASNFGRVRSVTHLVQTDKFRRIQYGRILKTSKDLKGYLRATIMVSPKVKFHTGVHRLVALAFIPNNENKPQVNHKDGNKQNNNVHNLEWCTNRENQIHAINMGLTRPSRGINHHNSKLTKAQVSEIKQRYINGETLKDLSKIFHISATSLSYLINNRTYKNI